MSGWQLASSGEEDSDADTFVNQTHGADSGEKSSEERGADLNEDECSEESPIEEIESKLDPFMVLEQMRATLGIGGSAGRPINVDASDGTIRSRNNAQRRSVTQAVIERSRTRYALSRLLPLSHDIVLL